MSHIIGYILYIIYYTLYTCNIWVKFDTIILGKNLKIEMIDILKCELKKV